VPIRPKTHRASATERRNALLRAAVEVVAERGVAGATHRAIAAKAGLPPATTSYFFASKDELAEEALRVFVGERVAELESQAEAVSSSELAPAMLAALVARELARVRRDLALAQFELYLEAARNPAVRESVAEALAAFERLAAVALRAAGAPNPEGGARAFVALADGFAIQRLARADQDGDVDQLREAFEALFIAQSLPAGERRARLKRIGAAR
jgi:DNA-binding transcriptional regulator YbjK